MPATGTPNEPRAALAFLKPLMPLRFLAAAYIVGAHCYRILPPFLPPAGPPVWLVRVFSLGFAIVGLFFVLSGFGLASVYLSPRNGEFRKPKFFLARFARLYPVYIASLLLDAPRWLYVMHGKLHFSAAHIGAVVAANLLLLQAWAPENLLYLNPASWFLSGSLFFYAMFTLLGAVVWRLPARAAIITAVVLYLAGSRVALLIPPSPEIVARLYYLPLSHLHEFLLGILLARVWITLGPGSARPRLRSGWLTGLAAVATLALVAGAWLVPLERYRILLQHGVLFPLYAPVVLLLTNGTSAIARLMTRPALIRLGEASYGLYLFHGPLLAYFHADIARHGWPVIAYVALCLALSLASVRWLETPMRRTILDWRHARTRKTAAAASLS